VEPDGQVFNDVITPLGLNNVKRISKIKWYKIWPYLLPQASIFLPKTKKVHFSGVPFFISEFLL